MTTPSVDEDAATMGSSHTAGGIITWEDPLENCLAHVYLSYVCLPCDPASPLQKQSQKYVVTDLDRCFTFIPCCCCSAAQSCPTLCDPIACQASLSFTISLSLIKIMSIESVMPSNHLVLWCPLLLLPLIFSSIRVFSSESALHIRWPKY